MGSNCNLTLYIVALANITMVGNYIHFILWCAVLFTSVVELLAKTNFFLSEYGHAPLFWFGRLEKEKKQK